MKISKNISEFTLEDATIDLISEKIQAFLESLKTEKKNIIRLRLTIEDMLLKWKERYGTEQKFTYSTGSVFGKPYISFELAGEQFDPFESTTDEFGDYITGMLSNMGLCPVYNYQKGINRISLRLKKKRVNPLIGLLISVILSVSIGILGFVLPSGFRTGCSEFFLTPIYETFFGILSTISGPMIFLSVALGIYGIGDASILGRIGKKMLFRFVGITLLSTTAAMVLLMPFSKLNFASGKFELSGFQGVFGLFLDIFPDNIISPFIEGNTMQIILIAIIVGYIMLILGSQTKMVAEFIEQINYIIQYLMELISYLVPALIFVVLLRMIWSDSIVKVFTAWKPFVSFVIVTIIVVSFVVIYVCIKERVHISLYIKKIFPTFLIALTTASSSASFGSSVSCCEHSLGLNSQIINFGIPLSIVLYKPITAINFVACALYFSEIYNVEVSLVWIITAIIVITVTTVALPPIPGGGIACYTIIFLQLGIPAEALGVVVILDVIVDFICTGFDSVMLQSELVLEADAIGMLNKEILRK